MKSCSLFIEIADFALRLVVFLVLGVLLMIVGLIIDGLRYGAQLLIWLMDTLAPQCSHPECLEQREHNRARRRARFN
jgi:hypothetical protein